MSALPARYFESSANRVPRRSLTGRLSLIVVVVVAVASTKWLSR